MPYETIIDLIKEAIIFIFPAYCANAIPVLAGGGKPIDFGKNFLDGKRLLGDGKTFRGFIFGVLGGIFIANLQYLIEIVANVKIYSVLNYTSFVLFASTLAVGSLLGDMFGSFIKRRLNIERGKPVPLLDQLDFLVFSLGLALLILGEGVFVFTILYIFSIISIILKVFQLFLRVFCTL